MMELYRSKSGKISGVTAFEEGDNSILVEFNGNVRYLYTYDIPGFAVVEQMKSYARASVGLSTYIAKNNFKYEKKFF